MSGDSSSTAEMSVEDLQRRLEERQRLVEELTARLEQAAEQLDRLKRSGAGRGLGGIPSELINQQRSLTEELQNAVQQWEEMQPTELLARVEMQVVELRDLIVDRFNNASLSFAAPADPASHETGDPHRSEAATKAPPARKSARPTNDAGGLSSYEAFKAGLMDTDDDGSADEPHSPADGSSTATEAANEPAPFQCPPPVEVPAVDPPDAVDFATATLDDLRGAVDERDSYIAYLIRRLRAAESVTRPAGNWSNLESVPDEFRSRLEEHERRLQESLRLAEVETSLERARLAREAMRLEHLGDQLRKKALQLGVADDDPANQEPDYDGDPESAKKNGRWFRLFGK
jgi:hypothetical protein